MDAGVIALSVTLVALRYVSGAPREMFNIACGWPTGKGFPRVSESHGSSVIENGEPGWVPQALESTSVQG